MSEGDDADRSAVDEQRQCGERPIAMRGQDSTQRSGLRLVQQVVADARNAGADRALGRPRLPVGIEVRGIGGSQQLRIRSGTGARPENS